MLVNRQMHLSCYFTVHYSLYFTRIQTVCYCYLFEISYLWWQISDTSLVTPQLPTQHTIPPRNHSLYYWVTYLNFWEITLGIGSQHSPSHSIIRNPKVAVLALPCHHGGSLDFPEQLWDCQYTSLQYKFTEMLSCSSVIRLMNASLSKDKTPV
jgi:hypothetical protein